MTDTLNHARALSIAALLALCSACGGGSSSGAPMLAPAISTQPASVTVSAGSGATFTVAATGSAPLSYQWKRNGADIAGATSPSYTIPSALLSDTRSKWRVELRNSAGTATSAEATLHVTGIAVFAGAVDDAGKADGPIASARFSSPYGLAFDKGGNLLVADPGNLAVRKISPSGLVSTLHVAGDPLNPPYYPGPTGLAVDGAGNAYTLNFMTVTKITPAGVASTLATIPPCTGRGSNLCRAGAIALDASNNVYVSSWRSTRKIAPDGSQILLEGEDGGTEHSGTTTFDPKALAFDGKSSMYLVDWRVRRFDATGGFSTLAGRESPTTPVDGVGAAASLPYAAAGAVFDAAGNLYFSAPYDHTIRRMTPAGAVSTLVGVPGQAAVVTGALPGALLRPMGMAMDPSGDLYAASGNAILKIQLPPQ